jgi:uncharacterized membrane protein
MQVIIGGFYICDAPRYCSIWISTPWEIISEISSKALGKYTTAHDLAMNTI